MERIRDRLTKTYEQARAKANQAEKEKIEKAWRELRSELQLEKVEGYLQSIIEMNFASGGWQEIEYRIRPDNYKMLSINKDPEVRRKLQDLADQGLNVYASWTEGIIISCDPGYDCDEPGDLDISDIDAELQD